MKTLAILLCLGVAAAMAQDAGTNPKAKAAFDKAENERKTDNNKAAVADYQKAIELDPNFTDAQQMYIFASQDLATTASVKDAVFSGKATKEQEAQFKKEREQATAQLEAQYKKWAAAHPKTPGYQWALGDLNIYKDPKAAIGYFESSVKLDPKFAPGYQSLALMSEVQGDLDGQKEYLRKAVEAAPNDPKYLFDYAYAFHDSDVKKFQEISEDLIRKFPESRETAQAYYWLADTASTDSEKLHYLEALYNDKAPAAQDWKGGGLNMLFEIDAKSDMPKALALAQEVEKIKENDKDDLSYWKAMATYAQNTMDAEQLLKDGKADAALAKLDEVKLPRWAHAEQLQLERERAHVLEASGQKQKAYDIILDQYAKRPTDDSHALLVQYGQGLGKDATAVDAEIWAAQEKNAKAATEFSLPSYTSDKKKMSLADFHGHVVLLNFWYPLCGPCRGEFPFIQSVLDKYKDQGFEIVAVNVEPEENDFVLPIMKGFHLGFIPLEGSGEFATESYHVRGEPTNFLIGADGKLYFGPLEPISSPNSERTLELQVLALLRQQKDAAAQGETAH
ncbi:MAG TPA: redoxin family protein [Candidatus Koribacter sp.]